jgi:hypothetical protein
MSVLFGGIYFILNKKPKTPEYVKPNSVWKQVYRDFPIGTWTNVYIDTEDNFIRGKVVKTDEGLYRATMWNGATQEFFTEQDAIKKVEQYRSRVYK